MTSPTERSHIDPSHVEPLLDDRYELVERLGEGGMGDVYRAIDRRDGRAVAIKLLHAGSMKEQSRMMREAESTTRIQHANVVDAYEAGVIDEHTCYLVLELLEGESMAERIRRGVPLERAYRWLDQLAEALSAVHAAGVVHRDVKPANVFVLDGDETIKLIDFGLSKAKQDDTVSEAGEIIGTPGYLAPEQVLDQHVDARTDVHAFAVTAFELITGERAFGGHFDEAIMAVLGRLPAPAAHHRAGVSMQVDAVLRKALAKDPAKRYADAAELLEAWRAAVPNERAA